MLRKVGCLEVAREPALGSRIFRAYVPDRQVAEAVLGRWWREYPGQVVQLMQDGIPWKTSRYAWRGSDASGRSVGRTVKNGWRKRCAAVGWRHHFTRNNR
jgi:hypothetical protein